MVLVCPVVKIDQFMKTCKLLRDPTAITLQVKRTRELSDAAINTLIDIFNQFGCVILVCPPFDNLRENLMGLKSYFGQIIAHRSSDPDGVALVTPTLGTNYTA